MTHPHPARGFTLTELLVVLVIAAALAAFGTPAFAALRARWQLRVAASALLSAAAQARVAALSQGKETWLCPSNDGRTCSGSEGRGFVLLEGPVAGPAVLRRSLLLPPTVWALANRPQTRYYPWPRSASTVTWTFCSSGWPDGRQVVISQAGRPRVVEAVAACR